MLEMGQIYRWLLGSSKPVSAFRGKGRRRTKRNQIPVSARIRNLDFLQDWLVRIYVLISCRIIGLLDPPWLSAARHRHKPRGRASMPKDNDAFTGFDTIHEFAELFFDLCNGRLHDHKFDHFFVLVKFG